MKIYILQGNTGQYDDYCEWSVRAYNDEASAQHDCDALNFIGEVKDSRNWDLCNAVEEALKPFDPSVSVDGYVHYSVYELDLVMYPQMEKVQ